MQKKIATILCLFVILITGYFAMSNAETASKISNVKKLSAIEMKSTGIDDSKTTIKKASEVTIASSNKALFSTTAYDAWTEIKELLVSGEIDIALEKTLINTLQQVTDKHVYEEMSQLLQITDLNLVTRNQEYLLSLLAVINTEESVTLLLQTLQSTSITDSNAIYVARKSIRKVAIKGNHISLFESSFIAMDSNNIFLPDIADGIVKNAQKKNLDFLVAQGDTEGDKSSIALTSMINISNEQLVPELQHLIQSRNAKNNVSLASLQTLANMGQYEAYAALIEWSSKQPISSKQLVSQLFTTAGQRSPSAYRAIEKELNRNEFISDDIKHVIEQIYSNK